MYPILECYFVHGIVFKPHLQNVMIGLSDNRPTHVYLRNFGGAKLILKSHPEDKREPTKVFGIPLNKAGIGFVIAYSSIIF